MSFKTTDSDRPYYSRPPECIFASLQLGEIFTTRNNFWSDLSAAGQRPASWGVARERSGGGIRNKTLALRGKNLECETNYSILEIKGGKVTFS